MSITTPWAPARATKEINAIAKSSNLSVTYKMHAKERLDERGLIISDILHVLKKGFVYKKDPAQSTRKGYYKYPIDSTCPNGGNRLVRVIVIPDKKQCELKVISVMWVDEKSTKSGTLAGD